MSLLSELKRRNVFRVAAAYLIVAWLLLQVSDTLAPALRLPEWFHSGVAFVLILGFPLVIIFAWAFELTPEGLRREGDVEPSASISRLTGRKLDFTIIALLAVSLAYFIIERQTGAGPGSAEGEAVAEAGPPHASVAVLPFVNISGDPDNEYFSDGLTETLLHMLAQIQDLQVSARTSSFAFKGQDTDIREIARLLGVAHVLEGSVQKAADRVRITAQLIRANDGFHVWSQNYDRTLDDIFAIQDEIAREVTSALGGSLLGATDPGNQASGTASLAAYDLYLKALEQQHIASDESFQAAEALFRRALEEDPDYVDAQLGLARNHLVQIDTSSQDRADLLSQGSVLISRVLLQQPGNSAAQGLELFVGFHRARDGDRAVERELLLNRLAAHTVGDPSDAWLVSLVSYYLGEWGTPEQANEVLQAGLKLDPLNNDLLWTQANFLLVERPEEARQILLGMVENSPEYFWSYQLLGELEWYQGNLVAAADWMRQALEVNPDNTFLLATTTFFFGFNGLPDEGRYWLDRLEHVVPDSSLVDVVAVSLEYGGDDLDTAAALAADFLENNLDPGSDSRFDLTVFFYALSMAQQGREHEALAFLQRVFPAIEDYTRLAAGRHAAWAQMEALCLRYLLEGSEAIRVDLEAWLKAAGDVDWLLRWNMASPLRTAILRGDMAGALELFDVEYVRRPFSNDLWKWILPHPMFAEFRARPRVAARLAEVEAERAEAHLQLQAMLEQPEWQH